MKKNFSIYADQPITTPGVINHAFIDASEQPGQFAAEECNRQAVTVRWLFEHPDAQGYIYSKDNDDLGLDPWRMIDGTDKSTRDERYFLDFGRASTRAVASDFVVYVSRKDVS